MSDYKKWFTALVILIIIGCAITEEMKAEKVRWAEYKSGDTIFYEFEPFLVT